MATIRIVEVRARIAEYRAELTGLRYWRGYRRADERKYSSPHAKAERNVDRRPNVA